MVMRNSVKSLQNAANEAMLALGVMPVTPSAYCQARYKLKHSAFMALNKSAVQRAMYEGGEYQLSGDFGYWQSMVQKFDCLTNKRFQTNSV